MKSLSNTIKLWRMVLWAYLEWPLVRAGKFAAVTLSPFMGNWIAGFIVSVFGPPREPVPVLYLPISHAITPAPRWLWDTVCWSFFGWIVAMAAVGALLVAVLLISVAYDAAIKALKWVARQVRMAPSLARELLEKEQQALREKREAAEKVLARREQADRDRAERSQQWQDKKGRISSVEQTAGPGDIQEAQEGPNEPSGDVSGVAPDSLWYFPDGEPRRTPLEDWFGLDGVARHPSEIGRARRGRWQSSQTTVVRREPDLTDGWNAQIEEYERQIEADARQRELDIEKLMSAIEHPPSIDELIKKIIDAGTKQEEAEKKLPHERDNSIEREG